MSSPFIKKMIMFTLCIFLVPVSHAECDSGDVPEITITHAGFYRYFRFLRKCDNSSIHPCSISATLTLTKDNKSKVYEMNWMPGLWFAEVPNSKISNKDAPIYYQIEYFDKKDHHFCSTSMRRFYFRADSSKFK